MSDFFGGLNSSNVRFTDARINGDGPLPTNLSGPEGINGDPDGRYNFNDALLAGITPYAGPQAGRMGSDRNYQQIPHRKQFPVPKIFLPEPAPTAETLLDMSHPIDMGDLVFIVNMNYKQYVLSGNIPAVQNAEDNTLPNYNVFCNICTVNYLLAGIQNFSFYYGVMDDMLVQVRDRFAWYQLMRCLNIDLDLEYIRDAVADFRATGSSEEQKTKAYVKFILLVKVMLQKVIRDNIKPIGICSTSEKQGGQHETGLKPVQAAASFFVTLTVDGQNRDLVNIWRGVDVEGGDLLLVQLEYRERKKMTQDIGPPITQTYVLNHYYKGWVQRSVQMHPEIIGMFQLVPGVLRTAFSKRADNGKVGKLEGHYGELKRLWHQAATTFFHVEERNRPPAQTKILDNMLDCVMDNRHLGYWHIGQVYNKKTKFCLVQEPADDMEMTKGQLLQVNFAPTWNGRIAGEAQKIVKKVVNVDEPITAEARRNLCGWLCENRTDSVVWFDLTMAFLFGTIQQINKITDFIAAMTETRTRRPVAQVAPGEGRREGGGGGAGGEDDDEMQEDDGDGDAGGGGLGGDGGGPGGNVGGIHAMQGAAGLRLPVDEAPVKRFKKSAAAQEPAAAGEPLAASQVAQAAQAAAQAAVQPAVAGSNETASAWDFEKDLEQIFATGARGGAGEAGGEAAAADKPRGKGKAKPT